MLKNEFDKHKAEREDYNIFRFEIKMREKEKKKQYQLIADEEYVFSLKKISDFCQIMEAKEIIIFIPDAIIYQYSITQKNNAKPEFKHRFKSSKWNNHLF